jgi:hypothetical protein
MAEECSVLSNEQTFTNKLCEFSGNLLKIAKKKFRHSIE